MKKFLFAVVICLCVGVSGLFTQSFATLDYPFGESDTILTNQESDVIGDAITDSVDPLRDGTKLVGKPLGDTADGDGIYFDDGINTTSDSWTRGTRFVKGLLNWALGIAGLVALVYLIYHGILAVTAGTSDDQYKKGMSGIQHAFYAIAGIGIAWFIISLVFWLINLLTVSA